jgi:hypothetical protein
VSIVRFSQTWEILSYVKQCKSIICLKDRLSKCSSARCSACYSSRMFNINILTRQLSQYRVSLQTGRTGFDRWHRQRIFPLASLFKPALRPAQLPIQRVPVILSWGKARPGRDANCSPPFSAEVKNELELYSFSPLTPT